MGQGYWRLRALLRPHWRLYRYNERFCYKHVEFSESGTKPDKFLFVGCSIFDAGIIDSGFGNLYRTKKECLKDPRWRYWNYGHGSIELIEISINIPFFEKVAENGIEREVSVRFPDSHLTLEIINFLAMLCVDFLGD